MHLGNALIDGLIFSSVILLVAVIFGLRAENKQQQVIHRPPSRARRRSVELKPQARVRVGAAGGR